MVLGYSKVKIISYYCFIIIDFLVKDNVFQTKLTSDKDSVIIAKERESENTQKVTYELHLEDCKYVAPYFLDYIFFKNDVCIGIAYGIVRQLREYGTVPLTEWSENTSRQSD